MKPISKIAGLFKTDRYSGKPAPRLLTFTVLAAVASSAAPAHAQGLIGQPVNVNFFNINSSGHNILSDYGTQTIIAGGNTFAAPAQKNLLPFAAFVTPTQVTYTATTVASFGNGNFSFAASEMGSLPATIIGVAIDPSTTVTGFPAAKLTFDASDIYAEIDGVHFQSGQKLVLDVVSTPAAVPEASTTLSFCLLLAFGLGGMVLTRQKKTSVIA